ncbi:unnamed protein product [Prorocentrum cordatum]|uniref:PROP1-like PPR domain-containing protein n=1 Tax=Prorocentrum cordatum TaxID=2364126 RepID=A0ABN9YCL7_9DINO|nr:unnamed protein product [Polarella glacialis]
MAMLVEPGAIEHMYVVCLVQAILAQAISATRICGSLRSTLSFRMLDFGRGSRESAISLEALIKNCGRTKQWSAALRLLRDAIRFDVQLVPSHYIATVSACRKGGQWQHALSVLSEMWEAKLEPNVISYSAGISACEKGEQWQRALSLLSDMWEGTVEPTVISYNAGIIACDKGKQWQIAVSLLSHMWEAKLVPGVASYSIGVSACERVSCANCLGVGGLGFLPRASCGRS